MLCIVDDINNNIFYFKVIYLCLSQCLMYTLVICPSISSLFIFLCHSSLIVQPNFHRIILEKKTCIIIIKDFVKFFLAKLK